MKIKKQFKYPIYFFIIYIPISVLIERYTGFVSKSETSASNPFDWNEIFHHLPHTILTALVVGVISGWFINRISKKKDEIRKRNAIEEDSPSFRENNQKNTASNIS